MVSMMYRTVLDYETKGAMTFIDITRDILAAVEKSRVREGTCTVFLTSTTSGLLINEKDRMLLEDFKKHFQQIDEKKIYHHPSNAFSHLRASMLRSDVAFPVAAGKPVLGTWQSIILWEFDIEPRRRSVVVTVMGD